MKGFIDLHIHSNKSDGMLSPTEIVEKAVMLDMKAISITDHDSVVGVKEAMAAAKGRIEVIPGVEISCYEPEKGFGEVHILGFFFDLDAKPLNKLLEKAKHERIKQKKKIVNKLNELGFKISFEEVASLAKGEVGRPHIAQALINNYPEKFSSIQDVFNKYIRNDGPAFVDRENLTRIKESVQAIIDSGGVAVLGHPLVLDEEKVSDLVDYFIECRGKGIETIYPYAKLYAHKGFDKEKEKKTIAFLKKIAKEKNLFETGGSDFHMESRGTQINEMKVPYSVLEEMKKRVQ
ncbi:hypothetical protein AYK26_02065 [Euryarchaeota archaeon SM23-78]|nr:MAG: hypothetical protein AYK26_02065 [Euryarchaeota archaeon SM23-78]MBW3000367.1 PHP domain-containing protein [Candidatus Woesearchaeota archaeon]